MFKRGMSGNPYGRPVGAVNLATREIREAVTMIVNNNLQQLQTDIEGMEPRERVKYLLALMDFILPKLQRVQVQSQDEQSADEQEMEVTLVFDEVRTYECIHCHNTSPVP